MELDVLISMGKHPNLISLYGVCMDDIKRPIVVMERVTGPSLDAYLSAGCRGRLLRKTVLSWLASSTTQPPHCDN